MQFSLSILKYLFKIYQWANQIAHSVPGQLYDCWLQHVAILLHRAIWGFIRNVYLIFTTFYKNSQWHYYISILWILFSSELILYMVVTILSHCFTCCYVYLFIGHVSLTCLTGVTWQLDFLSVVSDTFPHMVHALSCLAVAQVQSQTGGILSCLATIK